MSTFCCYKDQLRTNVAPHTSTLYITKCLICITDFIMDTLWNGTSNLWQWQRCKYVIVDLRQVIFSGRRSPVKHHKQHKGERRADPYLLSCQYEFSLEYHLDNSDRSLTWFAILWNHQYLLFYVNFRWHKEFFVAPLWPTYILDKGIFWTPVKLHYVTLRSLSIRFPSMFDLKLYKLSVILFWLCLVRDNEGWDFEPAFCTSVVQRRHDDVTAS